MELVGRGDFDTIRMCFFVPGHGKNAVDRLFAQIAHAFNRNDVFTTDHLVELIQDTINPTGKCIRADNHNIVNWKNLLSTKYTSLKKIKSYRDFLVKRNRKGKAVVYCKECCYTGDYIHKNLLKENINDILDLLKESEKFTYEAKDMSPAISKEKEVDLIKMYDKFIDPNLRPEWLPNSLPSSDLVRQHRANLKKRKKG